MLIDPQNSPPPQHFAENLARIHARIRATARESGRSVEQITLVGASKGQSAALLELALNAGLHDFGESYVQDALPKMAALAAGSPTWHFIGALQANKTRAVAENFAWVHAIDRLRIAERLSEQRPFHAPALNVCVQVNIGGEGSKGGVAPGALRQLLRDIAPLPGLKLRGLMCLPPPEEDPTRQRYWLHQLRELFESVNADGAGLDTLSMGMSSDLEAAVHEGATLLRIGTALFGTRVAPPSPSHIQSAR
jgi:PLP dependent protein